MRDSYNYKVVGENIRKFIESRGISKEWVMERTGIGKKNFYDMLNGEGNNVDVNVQKINKLFSIKDPAYFYKLNFEYEQKIDYLNRKENFLRYVASTSESELDAKLKEGMGIFIDLVELVGILKARTCTK